eukprot:Pgem_evm1s6839
MVGYKCLECDYICHCDLFSWTLHYYFEHLTPRITNKKSSYFFASKASKNSYFVKNALDRCQYYKGYKGLDKGKLNELCERYKKLLIPYVNQYYKKQIVTQYSNSNDNNNCSIGNGNGIGN